MATPFMLSKDNIELQFATNHIGMLFSLVLIHHEAKKGRT